VKRIAAAVVTTFIVSGLAVSAPGEALESGVVGLVVTHQEWDDDRPWAKRDPSTRSGSGVVVEGPYILTTARMIADAVFIQVEKYGRATQFGTRVAFVDREIDLALLAVDDPAFFEDLGPVALAGETPVSGVVRTVRWNKQQLESLGSRVKRFEVQKSYLGQTEHTFLLAQTDLAEGGRAEPVFDESRLIGITASQTELRARVIPVEIIAKFLERATSGEPYREFPVLGVRWQVNEDPSLAASLGQTGGPRGILIRQVPWGTSACGVLKPRDILLEIDGKPIDAGGYYAHPRLGRLKFTNILVEEHEIGDVVPLRVIRDGRELDLEMALRGYPARLMLMPSRRVDEPPPYLIAGGLLFRELDSNYLRTWGADWTKIAPVHLLALYHLRREGQRPDRRRVVLLTSVLPSPYNVGYETIRDLVVERINDRPIGSMTDVFEAFTAPKEGFHTIALAPNLVRSEIVLDAAALEAATAEILEAYRIPRAGRLPASPLPDPNVSCPGDY
jgi:S1-C subfamily serine protease